MRGACSARTSRTCCGASGGWWPTTAATRGSCSRAPRSATRSELAERLVGLAFDAVTEDASPAGEKIFALWNPPVIDEESGARRSALTDASALMARLAEEGVKSIGFTRSRRAAELLAEFTRRELPGGLRDA